MGTWWDFFYGTRMQQQRRNRKRRQRRRDLRRTFRRPGSCNLFHVEYTNNRIYLVVLVLAVLIDFGIIGGNASNRRVRGFVAVRTDQ